MDNHVIFVDRRKKSDRRADRDPCKDMPIDLYSRKRRKSRERRDTNKSLTDDYYDYINKTIRELKLKKPIKYRALKQ